MESEVIKVTTVKKILSWVIPIVIGLLIALGIRIYFVEMVNVDGPSMEPTLVNNEKVLALKRPALHRGSVVVFDANGVDPEVSVKKVYVKRIIGLPGDRVESHGGQLYVNGKVVNQDFLSPQETSQGTGEWDLKSLANQHHWVRYNNAVTVPKDTYFVLGDHRSVSNDSRYFGLVPRRKIIGTVRVMPWSHNDNTKAKKAVNDDWKNFFD